MLVFVHGGNWVGGNKDNLKPPIIDIIPWFNDRGYMVVGVDFRTSGPRMLSPSGPIPCDNTCMPTTNYVDSIDDIAKAIGWLIENRNKYLDLDHDNNPDTPPIHIKIDVKHKEPVLLGYSSGAHLVALLTADESYLERVGLALKDIAAAIMFDTHVYDVKYALETLMPNSQIDEFIDDIKWVFRTNCNPDDQEAQWAAGSPSSYVWAAKHIPPTLLISARSRFSVEEPDVLDPTREGYISWMATTKYKELLENAGYDVIQHHYDEKTVVRGFPWELEEDYEPVLMGAVRPQPPHRSPRQAFGGNI